MRISHGVGWSISAVTPNDTAFGFGYLVTEYREAVHVDESYTRHVHTVYACRYHTVELIICDHRTSKTRMALAGMSLPQRRPTPPFALDILPSRGINVDESCTQRIRRYAIACLSVK